MSKTVFIKQCYYTLRKWVYIHCKNKVAVFANYYCGYLFYANLIDVVLLKHFVGA